MRKRNILLVAVALVFSGCQFGDELIAISAGIPVRLVSSTGSLDAFDRNKEPLKILTHVFMNSGSLHVVVRTYFYQSGPLARPYLTIDDQGHGVIHVDTKVRFGFSTKCEFLRQFEVELTASDWKMLRSLRVYNHDVDQWASEAIQLSDPDYMAAFLKDSEKKTADIDLTGVGSGC